MLDLLAHDVVKLDGLHGLGHVGGNFGGRGGQILAQGGGTRGKRRNAGDIGSQLGGNGLVAAVLGLDAAVGALPGRFHEPPQGLDPAGDAGAVVHNGMGQLLHIVGQGGKPPAISPQTCALDPGGNTEHAQFFDDLGEGRHNAGKLFHNAKHRVDVRKALPTRSIGLIPGDGTQLGRQGFQGGEHGLAGGKVHQFPSLGRKILAAGLHRHEVFAQGQKIAFPGLDHGGNPLLHAMQGGATARQTVQGGSCRIGGLGHGPHPSPLRARWPGRPEQTKKHCRHRADLSGRLATLGISLHVFP